MSDEFEEDDVDAQPDLGDVLDGYEGHSYKIWDAIAELVDNSVDSFQKNETKLKEAGRNTFKIQIKVDNRNRKLMVHDNAFGMNRSELHRALKVAKKNKWQKGIGKYGLGLKTSASWFGKKWKVTTKQLGSNVEYTATVDIPYLVNNAINKIPIQAKPVVGQENQSYTTIEVEQGVREYAATSLSKCKETLAIMYQRLLAKPNFEIHWRTTSTEELIQYVEPNIYTSTNPNGSTKVHDFPIDGVETNSQIRITGRYGIYPPQRKQTPHAGVLIFWRNRLIVHREKNSYWPRWSDDRGDNIFGVAGDLKRQRFFIQLNINDMDPTSLKDDFKWDKINPKQLAIFLRDYSKGHILDQAKIALALRTDDDEEITDAEKDNDDIDLEDLMESEEMSDALLLVDSLIDEEEEELTDAQRENLKKSSRKPLVLQINQGQPTVVYHESEGMVSSEKFMRLDLDPVENVIDVYVNPNHPFYIRHVTVDVAAYSAYRRLLSAMALAWWSTKNRETAISITTYLSIVSGFLKGRAVLD